MRPAGYGSSGTDPVFDLGEVDFHSSTRRFRHQLYMLLAMQSDARLVHLSLYGALRPHKRDRFSKDYLIQ